MKVLSLFFTLVLASPLALANYYDTPADEVSNGKIEKEEAKDASEQEKSIDEAVRKGEDVEMETDEGKEIEYDKDVLGDDEIEIND